MKDDYNHNLGLPRCDRTIDLERRFSDAELDDPQVNLFAQAWELPGPDAIEILGDDGELSVCAFDDFAEANSEDLDLVERVRRLHPGAFITVGGGSSPAFYIRRKTIEVIACSKAYTINATYDRSELELANE